MLWRHGLGSRACLAPIVAPPGDLYGADMTVTLKDVARLAGVSRSAVSRTFTEGASVSPEMRHKVETAAQHLGYYPNVLASSLTTGRTKLIGLVSDNFHNPFFLEIFDKFTIGLQRLGLRPLLLNLSEPVPPPQAVTMLKQYSVDCVIVASSRLTTEYARAFHDAGIPVVHAFGRATTEPSVPIVTIDNQRCGAIAAATLVARGYRRLGFMGGPENATSTEDRWQGFARELAQHADIEVSCSFADAYTFDAGMIEMLRLLDGDYAEAYFCGDDVTAIGALAAIKSRGLSCPDDVGIIGLNDIEMAGWSNIDLTTIRQPLSDIIDKSIDVVTELLDQPQITPKTYLQSCELIERSSLKTLR